MGDNSGIEWTEATWTPIRARNKATGKVGWHCEHVTPGCEFCYAESMNMRLGTGLPFKPGHRKQIEICLDENMLSQPIRWKRARMIFVCSMTDLFADFVTDAMIDKVFAVMALAPQHTFQVLTKRADRMRDYMSKRDSRDRHSAMTYAALMASTGQWNTPALDLKSWPLPNVWLGVSAEDQRRADERIPLLLGTPASVRFISAEPLLEQIDFSLSQRTNANGTKRGIVGAGVDLGTIDWVIAGGESGRNARPMHPDWARSLRDQCSAAGVPFFFKQWGEWVTETQSPEDAVLPSWSRRQNGVQVWRTGKKAAGSLLDGREHKAMPVAHP